MAIRLMDQMERSGVQFDKEFFDMVGGLIVEGPLSRVAAL